MKKLSIIAGLVFTIVFFASCEQNEIEPQRNYSEGITEPAYLLEPEFHMQNRTKQIGTEASNITVATEIVSAVENKVEE